MFYQDWGCLGVCAQIIVHFVRLQHAMSQIYYSLKIPEGPPGTHLWKMLHVCLCGAITVFLL